MKGFDGMNWLCENATEYGELLKRKLISLQRASLDWSGEICCSRKEKDRLSDLYITLSTNLKAVDDILSAVERFKED